jgi:gamma-glutamyltranspeptidase/glutathione hydrolase
LTPFTSTRPEPKRRAGWTAILAALALGCAPVAVPLGARADDTPGKTSLGIPGVRGGVVTTSEPLAAQIGGQILRHGGNAIDAAAAVQFALNVIEPQSSGIGGGGFMMLYLAESGETLVLDSRESAPAAATPDMFADPAKPGEAMAWPVRSTSGVAVGIPGTLLGVATALQRWGTIDLAAALAPAIRLAREGFLVSARLAESIKSNRLQSDPGTPAYDAARAVFQPNGTSLEEGALLIQPDLARTLETLAAKGARAFYECGFEPEHDIAWAMVTAQAATRAGNPGGSGRMTCADLANYKIAVRKPVEGSYRGYRVVSMPPPSSGGLTVIQILKLLEPLPLGDASAGYGFGTAKTLHAMIEASRLAFADRALWMGDTDFVDLPVKGLIDSRYIRPRAALIDPNRRMPGEAAMAGDPRPFDSAALSTTDTKLARRAGSDEEGLNTTHFTIVDRHGNIVSYTSTVESAWGTGLMVPGFGFLLNNELTDFNKLPTANTDPDNFDPGANDVAPGKRPRSSMAPTLVFQGDKPVAAFGSPGGSTIISSVLNTAINLIDHRMDLQAAIDAPRIAQTSADGAAAREIGFDLTAIEELRALGHTLRDPGDIGSVQAIVIDRADGGLQYGAADRRRTGGIVALP